MIIQNESTQACKLCRITILNRLKKMCEELRDRLSIQIVGYKESMMSIASFYR